MNFKQSSKVSSLPKMKGQNAFRGIPSGRIAVAPFDTENPIEKETFKRLLNRLQTKHPETLIKDDIIKYYKTKIVRNCVLVTFEKQGKKFGLILYFRKGRDPQRVKDAVKALQHGCTSGITLFSMANDGQLRPEIFRSFIGQTIYDSFNAATTAILNAIALGETPEVAAILTNGFEACKQTRPTLWRQVKTAENHK